MHCDRKDGTTNGGIMSAMVEILADVCSEGKWDKDQVNDKKWNIACRLCQNVNIAHAVSFAGFGGRNKRRSVEMRTVAHQIISAALILELPNPTVLKLIREVELSGKAMRDAHGSLFAAPLTLAVRKDNPEMIRILLEKGAKVNANQRIVEDAAIVSHHDEILRLLLDPKYGFTLPQESDLESPYERAIIITLKMHRNVRLVQYLLDRWTFYESSLDSPQARLRGTLMRTCCEIGDLPTLKMFVRNANDANECMAHNGAPRPVPSLIEIAAWKGHEHIVRYLLDTGANPHGGLRSRFEANVLDAALADEAIGFLFKSLSMQAATWNGHVGVAGMLLDAGVDLTKEQWEDVFNIAAHRHEAAGLVEFILSRKLPNVAELLKQSKVMTWLVIVAARLGNMEFIKLMAAYGVAIDDERLHEHEHNIPPPIIIAKAWTQPATVDLLLDLGAIDRHPLNSLWHEEFKTRRYPQPPPTRPECAMPEEFGGGIDRQQEQDLDHMFTRKVDGLSIQEMRYGLEYFMERRNQHVALDPLSAI